MAECVVQWIADRWQHYSDWRTWQRDRQTDGSKSTPGSKHRLGHDLNLVDRAQGGLAPGKIMFPKSQGDNLVCCMLGQKSTGVSPKGWSPGPFCCLGALLGVWGITRWSKPSWCKPRYIQAKWGKIYEFWKSHFQGTCEESPCSGSAGGMP